MEKTIYKAGYSPIVIAIDIIACSCLIGFYWLFRDINVDLMITTRRISGKTGLINTNQLDAPLDKISGIQVQQGLFGKIFNYGTIIITTASSMFYFKHINNPDLFRTKLNDQIEEYKENNIKHQAKIMAEAVK